jgi:hypothetical protein
LPPNCKGTARKVYGDPCNHIIWVIPCLFNNFLTTLVTLPRMDIMISMMGRSDGR